MAKITITEALAELNTIDKRLEKKRAMVQGILARPENLRDPLEKSGGSVQTLAQERQSIHDLEERIVRIRAAIRAANAATTITVLGITRTIDDWLTWRRDVVPDYQQFLQQMRARLDLFRNDATRKGAGLKSEGDDTKAGDLIVHLDERALYEEAENLENILGTLDGQLSLKNATISIDIP